MRAVYDAENDSDALYSKTIFFTAAHITKTPQAGTTVIFSAVSANSHCYSDT